MAKSRKLSLESFIYQVKKELLDAQTKHEGELAYFNLRNVQLEATVTANMGADGGVNLSVVRLGAKTDRAKTHTVRLVFDLIDSNRSESATTTVRSKRKARNDPKENAKVERGKRKYRR